MTEVTIRNEDLLSELNAGLDAFMAIEGRNDSKYHVFEPDDGKTNGLHYTSDEYIEEKLKMGDKHSGYPEEHFSQPLGKMAREDPDKWHSIMYKLKKELPAFIGAHSNALFNYYPSKGYVGWHTNWNANAYQILFSWSETGESWFKYRDPETKEVVTVQDKPGWNCRHYYFGHKSERDNHCWHAMYTECERITLAFKVVNGEGLHDVINPMAEKLRNEIIEDISENF